MTNHERYFEYLQGRSTLGLIYRRKFLYPKLARFLSGRVLDVGCGIGDMLEFRAGTVGTDINPVLVDYCIRRGLPAFEMSPDSLPFEKSSFDGLILDNVLEHVEEPSALLGEISRVLKPGGIFLVGVPGRAGYAFDPDHKIFYSEAKLIELITKYPFEQKHIFHVPFRWKALDSKLKIYAVYGVFSRRPTDR